MAGSGDKWVGQFLSQPVDHSVEKKADPAVVGEQEERRKERRNVHFTEGSIPKHK